MPGVTYYDLFLQYTLYKVDEMGEECGMHMRLEMHTELLMANLRG